MQVGIYTSHIAIKAWTSLPPRLPRRVLSSSGLFRLKANTLLLKKVTKFPMAMWGVLIKRIPKWYWPSRTLVLPRRGLRSSSRSCRFPESAAIHVGGDASLVALETENLFLEEILFSSLGNKGSQLLKIPNGEIHDSWPPLAGCMAGGSACWSRETLPGSRQLGAGKEPNGSSSFMTRISGKREKSRSKVRRPWTACSRQSAAI